MTDHSTGSVAATTAVATARTRALRALRIILPLHFAAVLLQSVSAGLFFSGRADAVTLHRIGGPVVLLIALTQIVYAVRLRRRGDGPAWFLFASIGVLIGELLQGVSGHNHIFWFHVPMGVLLYGGLLRQHQWIAAQPLTAPGGAGPRAVDRQSPGASPIEA